MIYILLRQTTEWENEAVFLRQLKDDFRPKVEMWNSVFTMPFHIFRHRIKQIAQLNLSRVENAVLAQFRDIPEGAVFVPVDDDDWFSPDLGTVLESEGEDGLEGYHWHRDFLESPPGLVIKTGRFFLYTLPGRERLKWTCSTNNYALTKNGEPSSRLVGHLKASAFFDREPLMVKRIDYHLSLMNRSLASQTSMGWRKPGITRRELIGNFRRYKRLYREFDVPELAWSKPYVKMMDELMDELKVK